MVKRRFTTTQNIIDFSNHTAIIINKNTVQYGHDTNFDLTVVTYKISHFTFHMLLVNSLVTRTASYYTCNEWLNIIWINFVFVCNYFIILNIYCFRLPLSSSREFFIVHFFMKLLLSLPCIAPNLLNICLKLTMRYSSIPYNGIVMSLKMLYGGLRSSFVEPDWKSHQNHNHPWKHPFRAQISIG